MKKLCRSIALSLVLVLFGYSLNANAAYLPDTDYFLEVAMGNEPGKTIVYKFAKNPSITTATDPETVWSGGGLYAFYPTTPQSMEVKSTSGNDVGTEVDDSTLTGGSSTTMIDSGASFLATVTVGDLAVNDTNDEFGVVNSVDSNIQITVSTMTNGSQVSPSRSENESGDTYRIITPGSTGAAAIIVYGLNSSGLFHSEVIALNGLNAVAMSDTYLRQYRAIVLTADSRSGAEGIITSQIVTVGTVATYIDVGNNQTQQSNFTVPYDSVGYFLQGYVAIGKGGGATAVSASFTWSATPLGGVTAVNGEIEILNTGAGWWRYPYMGGPAVPPGTDIEITCTLVSATVGVDAGYDFLVDKLF